VKKMQKKKKTQRDNKNHSAEKLVGI